MACINLIIRYHKFNDLIGTEQMKHPGEKAVVLSIWQEPNVANARC